MAKIQIDLPASFSFSTRIPVRITDLNYGGHAGNDTILSFAHEARMQFLQSMGYTELNTGGVGLIMRDAAIQFKKEIFYGDMLFTSVQAVDFTGSGFDIIYLFEKITGDEKTVLAVAKTGMVCFDYESRKVVRVPEEVLRRMKRVG